MKKRGKKGVWAVKMGDKRRGWEGVYKKGGEKVMAEFEITLRDLKRESVERERGKRKERKEKNALQ